MRKEAVPWPKLKAMALCGTGTVQKRPLAAMPGLRSWSWVVPAEPTGPSNRSSQMKPKVPCRVFPSRPM